MIKIGTLKTKASLNNISISISTLLFGIVFAWWGMDFPGSLPSSAKADTFPLHCNATPTPTPIADGTPLPSLTCSPTPTPYPPGGSLEILPQKFQNPDGATMAWLEYGGSDTQKKPGVIFVHGTNWNAGSPGDVTREARYVSQFGFFTAAVFYELAPNDDPVIDGYIPGQPCHELDGTDPGWRMTQEINDIKNYVKAMRADSRCTGWVGIVGGSAGATQAITVALDTNPSGNDGRDWPNWFEKGHDDRPDCAVMLSAIYDFSDWTPPNGQQVTDQDFVHFGMHNYAQTLDLSTLASLPLNPVNLVSGAIALGFKPISMFNSWEDAPTAYHQLDTMVCTLESSGLILGKDYQYLTIPGGQHSFKYWDTWDHRSTQQMYTVGDDVVQFLETQAQIP